LIIFIHHWGSNNKTITVCDLRLTYFSSKEMTSFWCINVIADNMPKCVLSIMVTSNRHCCSKIIVGLRLRSFFTPDSEWYGVSRHQMAPHGALLCHAMCYGSAQCCMATARIRSGVWVGKLLEGSSKGNISFNRGQHPCEWNTIFHSPGGATIKYVAYSINSHVQMLICTPFQLVIYLVPPTAPSLLTVLTDMVHLYCQLIITFLHQN